MSPARSPDTTRQVDVEQHPETTRLSRREVLIGQIAGPEGLCHSHGARHVIEAREWACWTDEDQLARLPDDLTSTARAVLPLLAKADVVDVVRGETELVPGVQLVPAPGHTIGHCVVSFGSGSQQAIFLADAILDRLQLTHPTWISAVDMVPDETVATRTRLLDEAARDGSLVLAYHVAGLGQVERHNGGYLLTDRKMTLTERTAP